MKVSVLMGSPRKKDSYAVCKMIRENFSLNSGVEFEYIFLKDFHVEDCRGCDQCFQKGEDCCPCKDELQTIKEKLLQADGIIFASPVYACQITAFMKRTIDRLSYLFHRQEFVGKPALTVVTTAGGGLQPTEQYLKMTACGWGCNLVGQIGIISPMFFSGSTPQTSRGYIQKYHDTCAANIQKLTRAFENAIIGGNTPAPTFYDIYMFQCLRSKAFVSRVDYDFWKEHGWLDSNYFYSAKLSPAKLIFAKLIRAYVDSMVKKMMATPSNG